MFIVANVHAFLQAQSSLEEQIESLHVEVHSYRQLNDKCVGEKRRLEEEILNLKQVIIANTFCMCIFSDYSTHCINMKRHINP